MHLKDFTKPLKHKKKKKNNNNNNNYRCLIFTPYFLWITGFQQEEALCCLMGLSSVFYSCEIICTEASVNVPHYYLPSRCGDIYIYIYIWYLFYALQKSCLWRILWKKQSVLSVFFSTLLNCWVTLDLPTCTTTVKPEHESNPIL